MNVQTDLTDGSVRRQLLRYTLPILVTSLLQSFYQVADMALVSQMVGSAGASAVGTAGQITRTIMIVSIGLSNGGNILVGQYFGGRNQERLLKTVSTFIMFFLAVGTLVTVTFFWGSGFLVDALQAPAWKDTYDYLSICSLGFVFVFVYNALAAILRALGSSRIPMECILAASILNIGLDIILMGPLHLGTKGAALATVISQCLSCGVAFWFLVRRTDVFALKRKSLIIHWGYAAKIFTLGSPGALSMAMVGISWLVVVFLINDYGVIVSAGTGIAAKIRDFFHLMLSSLGIGTLSFIAQNLGAGLYDRAKAVMYEAMKLAAAIALATVLLIEITSPWIVRIFTSEQDVLYVAVRNLRIEIICELFYAIVLTYQSMMNGAGHTLLAMLNSLTSGIFFRIPLAILLHRVIGLDGIFISCAFAPAIPIPLGYFYIKSGRWKNTLSVIKK